MANLNQAYQAQSARNEQLLKESAYMRDSIESQVLPLEIDIDSTDSLSDEQAAALEAVGIEAARMSISSLASLAKIGELDHLGGGLDLIPGLALTLAITDFEKIEYTIENAHCSIGYYSLLGALGYLSEEKVVDEFRRGIDIPGHVSWVPGGTQLNGGRLGVMIPVAVGQALGKKAHFGRGSFVVCHTGDAGWISGQALNGFNVADLHGAPICFVMHRNGIQLSGSNKQIMDKDPRPIIAAMGIEIIEIESLYDTKELYGAYKKAYELAQKGRPSMIYPAGKKTTLAAWGEDMGITSELEKIAAENSVDLSSDIWLPGSLMSYRDVEPMIECVFLCNELPGGEGHHDGHMKGREEADVLGHSMMTLNDAQAKALEALKTASPKTVVTKARPAPGSENLVLKDVSGIELPAAGEKTSARAGVQKGYEAVAKAYPENFYVISCDLDPSTKLDKAKSQVADTHKFEVSIEEQVALLLADGLAMSGQEKSLNVVSTFAAFFEGIAREGMELWRYQRNLNGRNEGLNAVMHMSHVGACTGRDHFSGWSLDWVAMGISYLPYLQRFYAPCDARSAFVAVKDLAAKYGANMIAIPRDNLPVLTKSDGSVAWEADSDFETVTTLRDNGANKAILAFGAPAYLAVEVAEELGDVDAIVVNGLPFDDGQLKGLLDKYSAGVVTIEDSLIGDPASGLRGFAALVATAATDNAVSHAHVGIVDPAVAPADGHDEVWEHFGLTKGALLDAVKSL